jgi:hypothetical protein
MKPNLFLLLVFLFSFYNCLAQTNDTAALRLNNYRDKVFSVFIKCNSQGDEVSKAIKTKNVNDIEAGRVALLQCADDGMKQLNTIPDFNKDPALKFSCSDVLKFYKQLAQWDIPQLKDFFILEEKFLRIKNEFEKKPARKHSQSAVDDYNSEVKKYNEAIPRYTQLISFITSSRKLTLYNWNASVKIFMDAHKPS